MGVYGRPQSKKMHYPIKNELCSPYEFQLLCLCTVVEKDEKSCMMATFDYVFFMWI